MRNIFAWFGAQERTRASLPPPTGEHSLVPLASNRSRNGWSNTRHALKPLTRSSAVKRRFFTYPLTAYRRGHRHPDVRSAEFSSIPTGFLYVRKSVSFSDI